jgi:hypothetical protein
MAEVVGHFLGFLDGKAGGKLDLYPDGAFVERGKEVFADGDGKRYGATKNDDKGGEDSAFLFEEGADVAGIGVVDFFKPFVMIEFAGLVVGEIGETGGEEERG